MRFLKKLIIQNRFLNDLVFNKGLFIKFNLRQLLFNLAINFLSGKKQGKFSFAHFSSQIIKPENIILQGKNKGSFSSFVLSGGCYIQGGNGVTIGDNVIFAPRVSIISANHGDDREKSWVTDSSKSVIIGDDCWLGVGCTLLPGSRIPNGCTVGAGAVVNKAFTEENMLIVGVPAKAIKKNKE
ncbi:acyltransferase [Shewanella vesiculosa]|uniref:acyltransferase n=1 Tax=Shewanella vesiculosa TaxID=518738 RepID=UPI000F4E248F|nr:acyltransferase [Shewanella vesiculosa]RPA46603.1 acyltransferase [Shewanella vesiculosa]UJL42919.1 acyltransferase [Shewanella vesiculosa]